ncbi:hypothetical protein R75461_01178 [Paraburkholderia nemoris]|uniref:HNH endonuclease n=1 Tax=Paraburkholderia nemoris TaxID=2793076 RepID=UPI001B0038D5|nr:HNH endonuclease [Paraburkholderia nemoris]CAE6713637.1 hypothetical protein R75461_01178 [Paraburkholderia nemoris]
MSRRISLDELIESRVERIPECGCWIWIGALFENSGYARVKRDGKDQVAHRAIYEEIAGPVEPELELDHLCRVRCCVNPSHVEPVTGRVNVLRGETIVRENWRKTHCHKGHPLFGENLFVRRDGRRRCRTCERATQKKIKKNPISKAKHAARERVRRAKEKQMKAGQVRQGDVFCELIEGFVIPSDAKEVDPTGDRITLALGEATGHHHSIFAEAGVIPAKLWDVGAERFLQVMQKTTLQHQEHGAIPLTPGVYRISKFGAGTQREYSPEEIRSVAD